MKRDSGSIIELSNNRTFQNLASNASEPPLAKNARIPYSTEPSVFLLVGRFPNPPDRTKNVRLRDFANRLKCSKGPSGPQPGFTGSKGLGCCPTRGESTVLADSAKQEILRSVLTHALLAGSVSEYYPEQYQVVFDIVRKAGYTVNKSLHRGCRI